MALIRKIKDGETTIYPITVDQAVFVGEDGTTLDEALNNKADKQNETGGFAGGIIASTTTGGAVGRSAGSETGGAVGQGAKTSHGFAGGYNAKTQTPSSVAIDAIQLGTGTNPTPKTLQIYDYRLMDADGNIPLARISGVLPNIKKNPNDTTGDIINGHLTIGNRSDSLLIGTNSFAQGVNIAAAGDNSHAEGRSTIANGYNSHAEGYRTIANGDNSHAEGYNTIAFAYQHVQGHFNKNGTAGASAGTTGDAFIIGNGASSAAKSNAFRVTYAGAVYGKSAFNSSGADYAEYFEWVDSNSNNEDRRGLFVTCIEDKIQLANPGDDIIGVISANPSVIGNAQEDTYKGMYEKDIFGAPIKDEDGNYKLNPNYDSSKEYIPYSERPEFGIVGLLGQLIVVDDGTCTVGGYCTSSNNGIGTKSDKGYKVLKRIDSNHIKILIK